MLRLVASRATLRRVIPAARILLRAHAGRVLNFACQRGFASSASEPQPREAMDYDVVIVGGGPAGLSAAIRLRQQAAKAGSDVKVALIEKGAEIGSHILSGNVFDPRALNELIPNWKEKGAPLTTPVTEDKMLFLTKKSGFELWPLPPILDNHGNFIISLSDLTKWLSKQAEELGVEIYPGFAAAEVLYTDKGAVAGVATGDQGIGKDGKPTDRFQRGIELRAKQTLFAEGARGSLSEQIMKKFDLRKNCDPQTYGLGVKEVWQLDPSKHKPGSVTHTIGWPADTKTWIGTFCYHMQPNLLLLGLVVGLDYENPYINPYMEFQTFKHHPKIAPLLEGAKPLSYGARVINEGGLQSIPKLTFPGGALIGCSAGFLNVPRIKGSHTAMKSGMLAADALVARVGKSKDTASLAGAEVAEYEESVKKSWIWSELSAVRNVHPSFKKLGGLYPWLAYSGFELMFAKGRVPWTFRNHAEDWQYTRKITDAAAKPRDYVKPDGKISFDLLTNLQRSGTGHNEDQPSHLKIKLELAWAPEEGYRLYGGTEGRFCPAKVYEWLTDDKGKPRLQINFTNCVHCKTCDIKPFKNFIRWTVPEGGGGPKYAGM